MKISTNYPNFIPAIKFTLDGLNYSLASDDGKKFSFMLPLASHKKGFDFYELDSYRGGVIFTIETMLGFKRIKRTISNVIPEDLTQEEWLEVIFSIRAHHLQSEEYQALKKGYIKTSKHRNDFESKVNIPQYVDSKKDIEEFNPLDPKLEYLRYKPKEEWNKLDTFFKSSDDFLKKSLEIKHKQENRGCMLFLALIISFGILASTCI